MDSLGEETYNNWSRSDVAECSATFYEEMRHFTEHMVPITSDNFLGSKQKKRYRKEDVRHAANSGLSLYTIMATNTTHSARLTWADGVEIEEGLKDGPLGAARSANERVEEV